MIAEHVVSLAGARRYLVLRSGLGIERGRADSYPSPDHTFSAISALEYVQIDPMRVLDCNHHLVLGARVRGFSPDRLDTLLYQDRTVVEVIGRNRIIVPVADFWMFQPTFTELERTHRPALAELEPLMGKILRRIEVDGPLSSTDFTETDTVSGFWDSDGRRGTRAVRHAIEWLWHFGRLAISHRNGMQRWFDLPERLYGAACLSHDVDPAAASAARLRKYCAAAGLVDIRDWSFGWSKLPAAERRVAMQRMVEAGVIIPVRVDGVRQRFFVPATDLPALAQAEGAILDPAVRFLPPLDNLIWWRERLSDVFDFTYTWEAYTPASRRLYGPYTCPILSGDRLVGRIDARLDRRSRTLVVNGIWWEQHQSAKGLADNQEAVLAALPHWAAVLGATEVQFARA